MTIDFFNDCEWWSLRRMVIFDSYDFSSTRTVRISVRYTFLEVRTIVLDIFKFIFIFFFVSKSVDSLFFFFDSVFLEITAATAYTHAKPHLA